MKIEMGESLIYSWLRHEKLCQLVQTNWKVSPFWELENRQEIEDLFVICRNYFLEKHSFDISKGCSLEQFLKQAEIDGIGIAYSTEAPYIYAVDVFVLFCNCRRNVALCVGQSWKLAVRIPRGTQMCMSGTLEGTLHR